MIDQVTLSFTELTSTTKVVVEALCVLSVILLLKLKLMEATKKNYETLDIERKGGWSGTQTNFLLKLSLDMWTRGAGSGPCPK